MGSDTVERPLEPMLGVDEAKDINAFYHNTAYRVRSRCLSLRAAAAAAADADAGARARAPPIASTTLRFVLSPTPPPLLQPTNQPTAPKQPT
jgi:hypothetical protein